MSSHSRRQRTRKKRNKTIRCNKINFKSKKEAEEQLSMVEVLNMSKGQTHKNKWLHTYQCDECDAWHVGHMNRKDRRNEK